MPLISLLIVLTAVAGAFIAAGVVLRRYELARVTRLRLEAERRAEISALELRELKTKLVEQAALARVGELAAVVAHEVRNPLAGLRGSLQILEQRTTISSTDQAVIREMIRRLDVLSDRVTDLLLYAKPRAPKFDEVSLRKLLQSTADSVQREAAMAQLTIDITGDAIAHGDAELLREVFLNLLLNAAQAVAGRGTVRVDVTDGDQTTVTISDGGPGIPAELRDSIFEPFFTTKRTGTGLGLAIVRRLVELHGGHVTAGAAPDGGTMMTVTLPAAVSGASTLVA